MYNLMTKEQQDEWADLEERFAHNETMRFTPLDMATLSEYRELAERLALEYAKEKGETK